ncbi:MAG: hypothetical protein KY464_18305, partial [Gemmatimonadetes bacterium]|nr:hypothetical protein [Gemmatimonadota bacterium]
MVPSAPLRELSEVADIVEILAPAKVNLRLKVLAQQTSGFHSLESIFCAISLADHLRVRRGAGDVELSVEGGIDLGPAEKNLVVRAARRFFLELGGVGDGARIALTKRIPSAAGLGGGSSDAAATLLALLTQTKPKSLPIAEAAARGFEAAADLYETRRPSYPDEAVDWLAAELGIGPSSRVLDVGAGTGKLTRQLVARTPSVIGLEPVRAMCGQFRQAVDVPVAQAVAEALEVAERAGLATRPTAELANERRSLRHTLAAGPPAAHYDEAAATLARARHELAVAEAEHAQSTQRLDELRKARRWRRNLQGIEMARQSVQVADRRCARAGLELDRAEARTAAL